MNQKKREREEKRKKSKWKWMFVLYCFMPIQIKTLLFNLDQVDVTLKNQHNSKINLILDKKKKHGISKSF